MVLELFFAGIGLTVCLLLGVTTLWSAYMGIRFARKRPDFSTMSCLQQFSCAVTAGALPLATRIILGSRRLMLKPERAMPPPRPQTTTTITPPSAPLRAIRRIAKLPVYVAEPEPAPAPTVAEPEPEP